VVESRKVALPAKLGAGVLVSAAVEGVRAEAAEAAAPDASLPEACSTADCWNRAAVASGSTHVLVIDGDYERMAYKLSIVLWNQATRETGAALSAECATCSASDMADKVRELSRKAVDIETQRRASAAAQAIPRLPDISSPPVTVLGPSQPPAPPPAGKGLAYSLITGGSVLVALGVTAWFLDGRGLSCDTDAVCKDRLNTKVWGAALTLTGGAGLAWGLWENSRESPRATLSLGPQGLYVRGRF
jgi:hypothetical protein